MNEWFSVNRLSLNIDKTNIVKFSSNHLQNIVKKHLQEIKIIVKKYPYTYK
jgi:hypothetical protein